MNIKVLLVDDCPEMAGNASSENELFDMLFNAMTRNAAEHSEESEHELFNTIKYIFEQKNRGKGV